MKYERLNKLMMDQTKDPELITKPKNNNDKAKGRKMCWTVDEAKAFMNHFERAHRGNPFIGPQSRRLSNGRMIFLSNSVVHKTHIEALLLMLISFGRFVHLNTGTHGMLDGSTTFWIGSETDIWLAAGGNKKLRRERDRYWNGGAEKFANEDVKYVMKKIGMLTTKSCVSIQIVGEDAFPQYPENCDIINTWCHSMLTPRCPQTIVLALQRFYEENATDWNKKAAKFKTI